MLYFLAFVVLFSVGTTLEISHEDIFVHPRIDVHYAFEDYAVCIVEVKDIYNQVRDIIHGESYSDESEAKVSKLKDRTSALQDVMNRYNSIDNEEVYYILKKFNRTLDIFVLEKNEIDEYISSLNDLKTIATDADIVEYQGEDYLSYYNDILPQLRHNYNEEELKYYWVEWRDRNSVYATDKLETVIKSLRAIGKALNTSPEQYWNEDFYHDELNGKMEDLMEQFKPFYEKLHAYVRAILFKKYGPRVIKPHGPIPDHLLEHVIWHAFNYSSYFEMDFPFENLPDYDSIITAGEFERKRLLEIADEFYVSLGFEPMPETFWMNNVTLKDNFICKTTVNDFTSNISIAYCNELNYKTLLQDHVDMWRLRYSMPKKYVPKYLNDAYNMRYSIGEAIALSATQSRNPTGESFSKDYNSDENYWLTRNFRMALQTIFNLPRYFAITKVMYGLLGGTLQPNETNKFYWSIMEKYGGIEPAADRSEDSLDLPYEFYTEFKEINDYSMRFNNKISSYQVYKTLCQKAGYVGELNTCDFFGSKKVGEVLKEVIYQGNLGSWNIVLETLLPEKQTVNAAPMLEYFEPIHSWLKVYIKKNKLETGWDHSKKVLDEHWTATEEEIEKFVNESSEQIYKFYNQINADLFKQPYGYDQYEDEYSEEHWYISKSSMAASELEDISKKAVKLQSNDIKNSQTRKPLKKLSRIADIFVLNKEFNELMQNKKYLHEMATDRDIPKYKSQNEEDLVAYVPDIQAVFTNSSDAEEMLYYWQEWREKNKYLARNGVTEMLASFKKAAEILETSVITFWYKHYKTNFIHDMELVIEELKPLYDQLYAFIRAELKTRYGWEMNELIPAHFYDQVLLQTWTNNSIIESYFPWKELPPVDRFIEEHKYDSLKLLEEADKFYQSLGMDALEEDFWKQRLEPQDISENNKICHATIYDTTPTVYMKYCDRVSFKRFLQAHGYLGRVHYAHEKRNLPAYFFDSYFFEYPIGEANILSAASPKHLQTIGLAGQFEFTDDVNLNNMFRRAMHTLINIHKYFVHTKVIHEILNENIEEADITRYYWELMIKYAGVEPPKDRKSDDFDFPLEFYTDLEQNHQVKKFISEVLGYQFYDALCSLSGHEGDLYNCDYFDDKKVGATLQKMMQLGSSKSWTETLKVILNDKPKISADAILKYYEPLYDWLKSKNDVLFNDIGFGTTWRKYLRASRIYDGTD